MKDINQLKLDYQTNFQTLGQVNERLSFDEILELLDHNEIRKVMPFEGEFSFYLRQLCIISLEQELIHCSKEHFETLGNRLYEHLKVPFGTGQQEVMWVVMVLLLRFFSEILRDSELYDVFGGVRTWPEYCTQVAYDIWRLRTSRK